MKNLEENKEEDKHEMKIIYLAGGCFWGMEKLMKSIQGVSKVVSGYINGKEDMHPSYDLVCSGQTGYKESVKVEYDSHKVSLDAILFIYFSVINPTIKNQQGNDIGSQYQTGIYYEDNESEKIISRIVEIEKERFYPFEVEIGPLKNFYPAEDYHQDYLDKNPEGYCHIPLDSIHKVKFMKFDPKLYKRPSNKEIKENLTEHQFRITQQAYTELAFNNDYWDNREKGIYVDVVTGEPLFSSKDKFNSSCGWPSFSKPIDLNSVIEKEDLSYNMVRSEVLSRCGNSHLGHVFNFDDESPNGVRYCINSASLRFIPYEDLENEGYGYLKRWIK